MFYLLRLSLIETKQDTLYHRMVEEQVFVGQNLVR